MEVVSLQIVLRSTDWGQRVAGRGVHQTLPPVRPNSHLRPDFYCETDPVTGWHKLCNPASRALRIFPIYEDFWGVHQTLPPVRPHGPQPPTVWILLWNRPNRGKAKPSLLRFLYFILQFRYFIQYTRPCLQSDPTATYGLTTTVKQTQWQNFIQYTWIFLLLSHRIITDLFSPL